VLSYPAEYGLPPDGTGIQLLEQIAALTDGRIFTLNQLLPLNVITPLDAEETRLAEPIEFWPWLLLGALALWPVEIAWRRWKRLRIQ
jgi:hypothetical protein